MSSVVFLRGVNVGKANRCQPAIIAKELAKFGTVNIGAVGTFVVQLAKHFGVKCEIMICAATDILDLASADPFARHPSGPDIIRFVNVLAKPVPASSDVTRHSSLCLPSENDWLLKIIAIQNRFVLGLYRRQMKAIGYLGKLEKLLKIPGTNRNWNTILKVAQILSED
jgi:uncharacterized protein (DUF1697 family)